MIRRTQFAGDHSFCQGHADQEKKSGDELWVTIETYEADKKTQRAEARYRTLKGIEQRMARVAAVAEKHGLTADRARALYEDMRRALGE